MNTIQRTYSPERLPSPTCSASQTCAIVLDTIDFITDADRHRDQLIKERLDAIAYPYQFFREFDEPNEVFAPRLVRAFPVLTPVVARLPIWPWCWMRCA